MKFKFYHLQIVIFAGLGLIASFLLTVDKIEILKNPDFIPPCNINPLFSCKSVMTTSYAELLNFPNSLIGIIGYTVMLTIGMFLLMKGKPSKLFMILANWGSLVALVFSLSLVWISMYQIGALCPYCLLSCFSATNLFFAITYTNIKLGFVRNPGLDFKKFLIIAIGFNMLIIAWIILKFPEILTF